MSSLATFVLSAVSVTVAPVPEPATFGDWIVACDNGRACEALAAGKDGGDGDWILSVERGPLASDRPVIKISPSFAQSERAARIGIDGRMSEFGIDSEGALTGDPIGFLRAVAAARSVELLDANGISFARLPTTGASAALRWIDDWQERDGTVTALVARGARPASAVPQPPTLPTIAVPARSSAPPRTLGKTDIAAIKQAGECFEAPGENEFYRLDAQHSVGIIPCILGAYQGSSMIVIIDESGSWALAEMEQAYALSANYGPAERYLLSMVTTPYYAEETRRLSSFAKGRGLSDCGSASVWVWDGKMFRLAAHNEMRECRGAPPGDWPSLWRTQNADGES